MSGTLNIKDPEAHRLALAIAQETGEPMTRVVIEALRDRLSRIERQRERASVSELLTIAGRAAKLVTKPYSTHGDELYDSDGLPK
ncbi:type II toxin-antitoxin system VapB family antitoxin [Sphingobium scionense]|jgi:antitoxin VapB|uniref:Transcription factor n=2 Tax=Sphingobium TaxID=165695 RepID=A0A6P1GE89_SPHYA|nr:MULTISPECIES: type II toxin-antitoxin system VapB family antitoxin [Sphingobium]MBB4151386.1 antitoxin VapB [Sphingobium scionense]QHD66700.1 transcription factor [Sphingobium yanoikuyae]